MKLILTGNRLREILLSNPNWVKELDSTNESSPVPAQEVQITTYADLRGLEIKQLSKKLTFSGLNAEDGLCANFEGCRHLESASARFEGNVNFNNCGLKTTEGIWINPTGVVHNNYIATFDYCKNLLVAQGDWPGAVSFSHSSVKKINNLKILSPNNKGHAVNFSHCQNLTEATGEYPGSADFSNSTITNSLHLKITSPNIKGEAATFENCNNLLLAQGDFNGSVDWGQSHIKGIDTENLKIWQPNLEFLAACFHKCSFLTCAQGNFPGNVDFSQSAVSDILKIITPSNAVILFNGCGKLELGKGEFTGTVDFSNTSIKNLDRLKLIFESKKSENSENPIKLIIRNCSNLKNIPAHLNINSIIADPILIKKYHILKNNLKLIKSSLHKDNSNSNIDI